MKIRFIQYLMLLFLVACDDSDYLDGYDRDALFASPSAAEVDAVNSDWNTRDLGPDGYQIVRTDKIPGANAAISIVQYKVGGLKQYGAIVVPESTQALPVRMFIGGFGLDNTTNSVKLVYESTGAPGFIFAMPALRGQSLSLLINGIEYTSPVAEGNHCDAFDGAADDAIAFLNVVEQMDERADVSRVSVRGGSRGGTVALLVGERDKRVKMCIAVASPADLLELTSKNENDATYQCQFLQTLDHQQEIDAIRHKMIASSPLYFVKDLPVTQVHFAAGDKIVPLSQGYALQHSVNDAGSLQSFQMYVYDHKTHSDIAIDNDALNERIEQLLSQL